MRADPQNSLDQAVAPSGVNTDTTTLIQLDNHVRKMKKFHRALVRPVSSLKGGRPPVGSVVLADSEASRKPLAMKGLRRPSVPPVYHSTDSETRGARADAVLVVA